LLREDEVFRAAVIGLLGLDDIRAGLRQLSDAVTRLVEAVDELRRGMQRVWEEIEKMWRVIAEVREEQRRVWEELAALRDEQVRVWQEIAALREEQRRIWGEISALREEQRRIWQEIATLREEQKRVWDAVSALREEQKTVSLRLQALSDEQRRVANELSRAWQEIGRVWREIRAIKAMEERTSISLEEEANEVVQYYLGRRGITIQTGPARLGDGLEFDIYGVGEAITVIGEAKVRAGPRTVERLVERVRRLGRLRPDALRGRIVVVLYCMRAMPGTAEAAERLGVWLLESGRERTGLPVA